MEENEKLKLDEKYMRAAIKQAQKAYAINETPIGCVIVYEGKIIGRGYNRRNTDKDPLAHAEIKAIKKASKKMLQKEFQREVMLPTGAEHLLSSACLMA